jgi:hypothetical protein
MSGAPGLAKSRPVIRTAPPCSGSSANSARVSVDFPQPDSPTSPIFSPDLTASDTLLTARNDARGPNSVRRGRA